MKVKQFIAVILFLLMTIPALCADEVKNQDSAQQDSAIYQLQLLNQLCVQCNDRQISKCIIKELPQELIELPENILVYTIDTSKRQSDVDAVQDATLSIENRNGGVFRITITMPDGYRYGYTYGGKING